jgi:tape measure domain-containing protein
MGNNTIEVHITAENESFVSKMREVITAIGDAKRSSGKAESSVKSFGSGLANLSIISAGVYGALNLVKAALDSTIGVAMKYNANMEDNQAAFEVFLGNSQLAAQYLSDLKKIAAETPFDLPGVADAGKKLLAFGFDANTALSLLRTVGDAAAGLGKGQEGIERIVIALGQMKAKGRVMGDELLQLTEVGIPAQQILAEKLHLTADQVKNIGDAGIDADTAIQALTEGMNERFGGMAEKMSNKMHGLISTIKDDLSNIGGFALDPLFQALEHGLTKVRNFTDQFSNAINGTGGNIDENSGALHFVSVLQVGIQKALDLFTRFTEQFGAYDDDGSFYMSEETLQKVEQFGHLMELAYGFALDVGAALSSLSPIAIEVMSRIGSWIEILLNVADTIVNVVKAGADDANGSFATTKTIIDTIVDAMAGFLIIEGVIKLVESLALTYQAVKVAVLGVRKAIIATGVAQIAMNAAAAAASGNPAALIGIGGVAATGWMAYRSGALDSIMGKIGGAISGLENNLSAGEDDVEKKMRETQKKINDAKNNQQPYPGAKPNAIQQGEDKKAIQESQRAMREQVQYLKDNLADQLEYFKEKMDDIELEFKQGALSIKDYYDQKEAAKQDEAQARIDEIQAEIATVQNTPYEHEGDRQKELSKLNRELNKYTKQLEKVTQTQKEIAEVTLQAKQEENRIKVLKAMGGPLDATSQSSAFTGDDKSTIAQESQIQQLLEAWGKSSGIDASYVDAAMNSSLKYGVDPRMVLALMKQESGGKQDVVSDAGAIGLMQLMPDTAAGLGVDPHNAYENIDGGTRYLADMLATFDGDFEKAAAAYNAGAQAVQKYNGTPPYKETQNYVDAVKNNYGSMSYIPDLRMITDSLKKAYADAYSQADIINEQNRLAGRGYAPPTENDYHGLDNRVIDVNNENEDVTNVSNMQATVKNALNGLAKEFLEQTGQKLMLTGGAETGYHASGEWGHEGGWKADIVNVRGFDDLFVKLAEKYGFAAGDEGSHYDLSGARGGVGGTPVSANANGNLDKQPTFNTIDASQLTNNMVLHNADSLEALTKYEKDLLDKLGIDLKLSETMSKGMQEEIAIETIKTAQEMRKYGSSDNADTRKKLQAIYEEKTYAIQTKYIKQDLDLNVKDLQDTASKMGYRISLGLYDAKDAVEKYFGDFVDGIDGVTKQVDAAGKPKLDSVGNQIHELEKAMVHYQNNGGLKEYRSIKEEVDKVFNSLGSIYKDWIQRIDDYAAFRTNLVENNFSMTTSQKDNAKKAITAKKAKDEGIVQQTEVKMYRKLLENDKRELLTQQDIRNKSSEGSTERQDSESMIAVLNTRIQSLQLITIPGLQESILLNKQLEKMPTLLEKIGQSGKQALDDGLVTFLTDGVNQAENLLDALNDLITSVLKSMQKIFAESIRDDLMKQWFPVKDMNPLQNTGYNMSFGYSGDVTKPLAQSDKSFLGDKNKGYNTGYDDRFAYSGNLLDGFTQQTGKISGVLSQSAGYTSTFISQADIFLQSINDFATRAISTLQSATTQLNAPSGASSALNTAAYTFSAGNLADVPRFAEGGLTEGPGTTTSDSILSLLSRKEFVVTAKGAKEVGTPLLQSINDGTFKKRISGMLRRINNGTFSNMRMKLPKFARGGVVGGVTSGMTSKFMTDFGANISSPVHIANYIDGHAVFDAYGKSFIRNEINKSRIKNAKLDAELHKRISR